MQRPLKDADSLYIIAGPCSAESKKQIMDIVSSFAAYPSIKLIRCGIWKPRTRPGGFEGNGETALKWIQEIKQEYPKAKFCCEIATPKHAELCLKYGMDAVWIGARTSGDPFSTTEIARALEGVDLPVFVKNPLTPDIKAWVGAIERFQTVGTKNIAAIHRGFDIYNNLGYRNHPLWEVAIELRRIMPEIPILCDPSHIGGKKELIPALAQTALDMDFDGLMIEVHPTPELAVTDAMQQITPQELIHMLETLMVRYQKDSSDEALQFLRAKIDSIDNELLKLLASRLEAARGIADVKREHNMTIFQAKRWDDVLSRRLAQAKDLGLPEQFVKEIYEKIHAESVLQQEERISSTK